MGNFFDNLKINSNKLGKTENNANTLRSTLNANVDLFGKSLRELEENKIKELFKNAFYESPKKSIRNYFNILDIRNGKGERKASKIITEQLFTILDLNQEQRKTLLEIVVELGRWDYIFWFFNVYREAVLQIIIKEMQTKEVSLLAKWLPSINSKKQAKRDIAQILAVYLYTGKLGSNLSEQETYRAYRLYRQFLSNWRSKLPLLVEKEMSNKNFAEIPYEKVPSKANLLYSNAFLKHDEKRRKEFLQLAKEGKVKVNQKVSYPYELIHKYGYRDGNKSEFNAFWSNLKQIQLPEGNILVVCDTSASMNGIPMDNSIGLGLYIAERNHGAYKDKVITFSENPQFIDFSTRTTPFEKAKAIYTGECPRNTNILATMKLIANSVAQIPFNQREEQVPKTVLMLTDMQFDDGVNAYNKTIHDEIESEFTDLGVKVPHIVYWNLNGYDNMPVQFDKPNVTIISGFSQHILTNLYDLTNITPEKLMLKTLEKYDKYLNRLNLSADNERDQTDRTYTNYSMNIDLSTKKISWPRHSVYSKLSYADGFMSRPNHKTSSRMKSSSWNTHNNKK